MKTRAPRQADVNNGLSWVSANAKNGVDLGGSSRAYRSRRALFDAGSLTDQNVIRAGRLVCCDAQRVLCGRHWVANVPDPANTELAAAVAPCLYTSSGLVDESLLVLARCARSGSDIDRRPWPSQNAGSTWAE